MMKIIKRDKYLNQLKAFIGKQIIKVLTGQRRVGKSVLLKQTAELIKEQDNKANIVFINKELHEFKAIESSDDLFHFVNTKLHPLTGVYLYASRSVLYGCAARQVGQV